MNECFVTWLSDKKKLYNGTPVELQLARNIVVVDKVNENVLGVS